MIVLIAVLGPVAEAARGGNSSPSFNLLVGFALLAGIWLGFTKKQREHRATIWTALAASLIALIFIGSGLLELSRR